MGFGEGTDELHLPKDDDKCPADDGYSAGYKRPVNGKCPADVMSLAEICFFLRHHQLLNDLLEKR